jgi:hypothetical protein
MAALLDIFKKGSTDRSVTIRVIDNTTGLPKADLAYNSAGIALWYRREGATQTAITEATLASLSAAHSDGGFLAEGDGEYRLDLPDAAFATGANYVNVGGTFTGYTVIGGRVRLVDVDLEDTVRAGLTALPNVASGNAGAIITAGTGTAQLSTSSGQTLVQSGTGSGQISTTSGIANVALTTSSKEAVADQVWDEDITGHVAVNSAGILLQPIRSANCQAGGSTTTIVLDSSASATDDYYNNMLIEVFVAGDGTNKLSRFIDDYVGSTKTATVATLPFSPGATYRYVIKGFGAIAGATAPTASDNAAAVWNAARASYTSAGSFGQSVGGEVSHAGTAQAGTTASITLASGAESSTNNLYRHHKVEIVGGTGAGQASYSTGYTASSRVLAVDPAFTVAPDNTSVYVLKKVGLDAATPAIVADAVWDEPRSEHAAAGSFGEYTNADVLRVSSDATAADNLEAMLDGTGLTLTNVVVPSVTTVTGNVNGNVGGNVTGSVGSVTGNVGGNVTGSVGSVTGAVGSVTGAVGSVTGNVGGNVTGSVGSLAAQAKADVNAEVLDVLNTDTFAEPGQEAPGATVSLVKKISYLYKAWRNKVDQTSTLYTLYNDDGATAGQKATVSDDGTTATRGEVGTGA